MSGVSFFIYISQLAHDEGSRLPNNDDLRESGIVWRSICPSNSVQCFGETRVNKTKRRVKG